MWLIRAAVVFSGNTYEHTAGFVKHLNLQFVSSSYKIQKKIIFPVVQKAWEKIKQNVYLCGDGWCDSPGQSAKYGTYTLMGEKSNLIVKFSFVQVTEVSSSSIFLYNSKFYKIIYHMII